VQELNIEGIAALIAAAIALAGWFITWRSKVVTAYSELTDDYRLDNSDLRQRIEKLEAKTELQHQTILRLELEMSQARERISVLEAENEILQNENDDQRIFITELKRLQDGTKDIK